MSHRSRTTFTRAEVALAVGLASLVLLWTWLPTSTSEASLPVIDIPHTVVSRVEGAYARYQKAQQLYNDYLKLRRMAEYVWRDPEYAIGEHIYLNSLRLAGQEGVPDSTLESFAYGVEGMDRDVRELYKAIETWDPKEPDLPPDFDIEKYGDLVRKRAEGRRELLANVINTLWHHRDQLVDGAIAKREVLSAIETAAGATQQLEALAHLAAMQVEEQMVARELQMAQANMTAIADLEANARHAEGMLAWEETFAGSIEQELVESEPSGLYPWS